MVGSFANEVTFGGVDAARRALGETAEQIEEPRLRSSTAAGIGTAGGIILPALMSGGTSLLAKGVSAPIRGVIKVGAAAESAAVKALAPTLGTEAAKKTVAQTIAGAVARGGAEGAVAGTGQLVQDVALERRDLSAESVLGTVGTGVLFGAGLGSLFGVSQATVPSLLKGANKVGGFGKKAIKQAFGDYTDNFEASLGTIAATAAQKQKLRKHFSNSPSDLPEYLIKDLGIENLDTADDLVTKNLNVLDDVGAKIGELSKQIDDTVPTVGSSFNRQDVYTRLAQRGQKAWKDLGPGKRTSKAERNIIKRYMRDVYELGSKNEPFSFSEIDDLRKQYAGKKYKGGGALESFEANFADELRQELRTIVDEIADSISPEVGKELRRLNKAYHVGSSIQKNLEFAAERAVDIGSPLKFAINGASRVAKNAFIKNDLAAKTTKFLEAISTGVKGVFVEKPKKAAYTFPATQILLQTSYALDENNKKPKTKQEAIKNIQKNISSVTINPDQLVDMLAKRVGPIAAASPEIGMVMQQRMASALAFLNSKLPKPAVSAGVFEREYSPSSMELAKFERYLQVIEQPLTIFTEIKQGTLTREHVEALQAVYPEVYNEIRVQVMDKIAETGNQLPYERKLQLGILLNIPADSSLQPQTIMQLQQSINTPPEQAQQAGPQFRPSAMGQTEMSERLQSGSEKLTNR
jgi:hypothetical protein